MIDADAVRGVLEAFGREVADAADPFGAEPRYPDPATLGRYRDRIVALAEDVGICGAIAPGSLLRPVQCDLTDGHRGMHSGLDWSGLRPDELGAPSRLHWSPLPGVARRLS